MIVILAQKWPWGEGWSLLKKEQIDWVVSHKVGQEKGLGQEQTGNAMGGG